MGSWRSQCCCIATKQRKLEIGAPFSERHLESPLLDLGIRFTHKESKLKQDLRISSDERKAKR